MSKYCKTPTVLQMEATECGAASLCMIMGYYGRQIPLERMRIEAGVSRDGSKASNVLKAARKFGLEAKGYRKSFESLLKLDPPCIIHWNFNHFLVFEGIKGKYAYLNDPAMGRRKVTIEELDAGFTGIVLTFSKTDSFVKEKTKRSFSSLIFKRIKGEYHSIAALIFLALLLVLPGFLVPLFTEFYVDQILSRGNTTYLSAIVLFMLGAFLFSLILQLYRNYMLLRLKTKRQLTSTRGFIEHVFHLPMLFFSQRYSSDIANRVSNNENVNEFMFSDFAAMILDLIVAFFYFVLLMKYSPLLTAIVLLNVILNAVILKLNDEPLTNLVSRYEMEAGKTFSNLYSGVTLTATLKASGAENRFLERIFGFNAKAINAEQQIGKRAEIMGSIPEITTAITRLLVLAIGGFMVIRGSFTAGMLLAFTTLTGSFMGPMNELMTIFRKIQTLKADMNRVADIENYPVEESFSEKAETESIEGKLSGKVDMVDIAFGYSILEPPLVEHFSFHLESGVSIALVGSSGSGKSTVSKIVSGLYKPWGGELLFDGIPSDKVPREVKSASIATVSQEINLFSGTIAENLTMWNSSIMESDIVQACKDACIHDVITSKPGAYDFVLNDGGTNLSGGQRQRMEIARALVTNPTVLILDEATSAVDPIVEKQIMDNIKRRGCTCIIVAHRLSAIRDCDEIIVMDNGKIVQRGRHEELSKIEGLYQELVKNL